MSDGAVIPPHQEYNTRNMRANSGTRSSLEPMFLGAVPTSSYGYCKRRAYATKHYHSLGSRVGCHCPSHALRIGPRNDSSGRPCSW